MTTASGSPTKPDKLRLAYLMITTPVPNTYVGGMMVTDGRGLPVEFRYTEPIQPTKIQQVLYGQVLSSYIKQEVILETLIKGLETKFNCLLVGDEALMISTVAGAPAIRITETQSPSLGEVGEVQEVSPSEVLLQITREAPPLRLNLPENPADAKALPDNSAQTSATPPPYAMLVDAGKTMDIYEPMKRIEKALEIICQEEGIRKS
ncbi:MAG: hypothetical protein KTR14_09300 [Vampirovibrio sp.]|nr:hypothetical protein [Vampirovibrio sp.]